MEQSRAMKRIDEEKTSHFFENGYYGQGDSMVDFSGTKCPTRTRVSTNLDDYDTDDDDETYFTPSWDVKQLKKKKKLTIDPVVLEEIREIYREVVTRWRNEKADRPRCRHIMICCCSSKISAEPTSGGGGAPGFLSLGLMLLLIFVTSAMWTKHNCYDAKPHESRCSQYDQFRCHNGGSAIDKGEQFVCVCPDGYFGDHCDDEIYASSMSRWMSSLLFQPKTVAFDHRDHRLTGAMAGNDDRGREHGVAMTRTRILPINRRSLYCSPHENMPSLDSVYRQVSQKRKSVRGRSPNAFARHAKIKNALYHAFYRYFALQFFDADFNPTVTGSQLYGADEKTRRALRSFVDGKLKTDVIAADTHHWSDRLKTSSSGGPWWSAIARVYRTLVGNPSRATGHRLLAADPLLFAVSTLWVREHNRVCDELASRWPSWTDGQLYATAKRTVVGEMMAIMMNDVLRSKENASPATNYDPKTWRDRAQDHSRYASTPFELLLSVMLPRNFDDEPTTGSENVFANDVVSLTSDPRRGSTTGDCDKGTVTTDSAMTRLLMTLARENSAQNFNAYRRHFGLRAYENFAELTAGDRDAAVGLESLYGHVDNVELVAGMMAERKAEGAVPTFEPTTKDFIMNSIMTNPLNGETMWKSETFGGDHGFDTVKSVNVRKFIRRNINTGDEYTKFYSTWASISPPTR